MADAVVIDCPMPPSIGGVAVPEPRRRGGNPYSMAERSAIVAYYTGTPADRFSLDELAASLGRPKTNISRFARSLGLTRRGRVHRPEVSAVIGAAVSAKWATVDHPKGFAGRSHSDAAKSKIAAKSRLSWVTAKTFGIGPFSDSARQRKSDAMAQWQASRPAEKNHTRARGGFRADIGMYVRSSWEANYARYLNWLKARGDIDGWEYEPTTFWFEAIKRGTRSYTPDFRITEKGRSYYVEVKGWMDGKSKTRLARMRRYYPDVEIQVVAKRQYQSIADKLGRLIGGWE